MEMIQNRYLNNRVTRWLIPALALLGLIGVGLGIYAVVDPAGAKELFLLALLLLAAAAGCLFVIGLYFLPTIVAMIGKHHNTAAIVVTNLLFGWTGIGWAVALIWSISDSRQ